MNKNHSVKFHKTVPVMTNGKNCLVNKHLVIGHSLTDFQIKSCYEHADEIKDFPEDEPPAKWMVQKQYREKVKENSKFNV